MKIDYMPQTNFAFLMEDSEQLVRLGMLAEKYFADDPNTCLLKLRQFAELLAKLLASKVGFVEANGETQYELIYRLQDEGIITREVAQVFGEIRRAGNSASHEIRGDHKVALSILKMGWQLGIWFHRTTGNPSFKPGPFIPPSSPEDQSIELHQELENLKQELKKYESLHRQNIQKLEFVTGKLDEAKTEQAFWEQMAKDADREKEELEKTLAEQGRSPVRVNAKTKNKIIQTAARASSQIQLDEAGTRQIIDQQLLQAGWLADSVSLRYSKGTRPEKGKNIAIAEWPTQNGPADYVLFVGLTPVATIEAKRKNIDVSSALQQAKRYCRGFIIADNMQTPGGPWDEFILPFAFSTNGRPFLRQMQTQSGIWFIDLRKPDNLGYALDGWYTPEGIITLLKRDENQANQQLETEAFDYGFDLRYYQENAIRAIEKGIQEGKREMLLAMATGTGKTKTCIALIYRLLKVKRFNRILFLVDRTALGEQAANAFKDTRMDSIRSFADIFSIMELDEITPESDTSVHIATVQGMVQRVLNVNENSSMPPIDRYDCIIVDECHRGYLLDRELSGEELSFRDYEEYISKYRRVLDYFDAVKIGLTATPALHTTDIFGLPIFTYNYREAVIDGYLIDHEPPMQLTTERSKYGIKWKKGEEVKAYNSRINQIDIYRAPDEIKLDIADFNRKVITEPFNKVICEKLAKEIDPGSKQKTLIFCANDKHADLVVLLLKNAFREQYGLIDDDAVIKITGTADKPLQLIRRFKNERNPNVAVTVDLLTTGIDVPEICNLAFLRRVKSRILFDQMMGRATRLCDEIGKQYFRIFDAVQLYDALADMTEMQPVVKDPNIRFAQLIDEISSTSVEEDQHVILDQFIAKLQRKKRYLSERNTRDFEFVAGMSPDAFIQHVRQTPFNEIVKWFTENPDLGEILDRHETSDRPTLISEHADQLFSVEYGYGEGKKPEDYLKEFSAFIQNNRDRIPALMTVLTRPKDLTRKQLRELAMELDRAGFSEINLETAWREMTNQEIAAHIVGFIRHIATGDPLIPYEQRVDWALQQMLASRSWTRPQRDWLQRIAAQTRVNKLVDREALDDPDLIFTREGGGYNRLNHIFENQLNETLQNFNDFIWKKHSS